ncbi:MAG TPA: TRAP transporter TatT component family protein [Candidatus Kapabacteria bacterium]|nr:TRAP transporter TatT component family protein [Candidatus Kapabacteria bacterium]
MKKRFPFYIFLIIPFLSIITLYSQYPVPADARELLAAADQLYEERQDLNKAFQAYEKYKEVLKVEPGNYGALWKSVKIAFYILEVLKDDKVEKREPIVNEAIKYAKQAVAVNPGGVEGHLWLGVIYTKYGEVKGVLKALFLVGPTKKEMQKAIGINDTYEGAGAYVVLGRVYEKVPGIFGGSNNKAREHYEKARKMCPTNTLNLLYMAENYWEMDEKALAIKVLEDLLALDPDPRWLPESRMHKKEAGELLEKFRNQNK